MKKADSDNFNHTASLVSAYDLNGRRSSLTAVLQSNDDFQNLYEYDNLNRLTKLTQQEHGSGNEVAPKSVVFTYNLTGQFDTITRHKSLSPDGDNDVVKSTYGYDRVGRLTSLLHQDVDTGINPAEEINDYSWLFDIANRIEQMTSVDGNRDYTYDDTNQLIEEAATGTTNDRNYAYDENGNRTEDKLGSYGSPGEYNRITSSATHDFTYDNEGNQIWRTNKDTGVREVMEWDHRNRLTSIETLVPREVAHWRFDGDTTNAAGDGTLDGSLVGGADFSVNAPLTGFGGSVLLESNGDYVSMGDENDLKLRDHDLSIALWINPDSDLVQGLAGQGNATTTDGMGYTLVYWGSSTPKRLEIRINDGSGSSQNVSMNLPGSLVGSWHHVAATIDRGGDVSIYLDGVLGNSAPFNQTATNDIIGTGAFVGGALGGGTVNFRGEIDDLRVWHEVLSPTDITALNSSAAPLYEVGKEVAYDYDAFDRRIRKQIDADGDTIVDETHEYVYDGQDIVLGLDGSGNLKNRFLHGPAVDMILADEQYGANSSHDNPATEEGIVYWPLTDHLGSVRDLADNNGEIAKHIQYDGFGQMTADHPEIEHIYGFTGREHDEESHLQFNRARYYDAAIGRWVREDPGGFAMGDENLYRYVHNAPTSRKDPLGLSDISDSIGDINKQIDQLEAELEKLPFAEALEIQRRLGELRTAVNNIHEPLINKWANDILAGIRDQLRQEFGIDVEVTIKDGSLCIDGIYTDEERGIEAGIAGDKDLFKGWFDWRVPPKWLPDWIKPLEPELQITGEYDPHADDGHWTGGAGGSVKIPDLLGIWPDWLPEPRFYGRVEVGPDGIPRFVFGPEF